MGPFALVSVLLATAACEARETGPALPTQISWFEGSEVARDDLRMAGTIHDRSGWLARGAQVRLEVGRGAWALGLGYLWDSDGVGNYLYEDLTVGIGCPGARPLAVLSDQWRDSSGRRLAHELGHALGVTEHLAGSIMGDADERTDAVPWRICEVVRQGARRLVE